MQFFNDAINRRQDKRLIIVETAIHRVSCLNRSPHYATTTMLSSLYTPKILPW